MHFFIFSIGAIFAIPSLFCIFENYFQNKEHLFKTKKEVPRIMKKLTTVLISMVLVSSPLYKVFYLKGVRPALSAPAHYQVDAMLISLLENFLTQTSNFTLAIQMTPLFLVMPLNMAKLKN
jgi:hypothetical protein